MNSLAEKMIKSMATVIGKELLIELWAAPWENFAPKYIDELGIALCSRTGDMRSRNEDRLAIGHVTTLNQERFSVAIICDGVGGSEMGDVAATLATATFLAELAQTKEQMPLANLLTTLIQKMDDAVRNQLNGRGMTTAGIVLASGIGQVVAANIGDSRIFSWVPGKSFRQISVDDTMENEFKGLVIDEAVLDARGLRGKLSQAIGEAGRLGSDLRIVVFGNEQLQEGGLLLATDGAWKADEKGFNLIARGAKSANDAITKISRFASWTGGIDNVSVIAIEDISRFAASNKLLPYAAAKSARVTTWICDTKFVVSDVAPNLAVPEQMLDASSSVKETPELPKLNRTVEKRPPRKRGWLKRGDQQLDLVENRSEHERVEIKHKIEISTAGTPESFREVYFGK